MIFLTLNLQIKDLPKSPEPTIDANIPIAQKLDEIKDDPENL